MVSGTSSSSSSSSSSAHALAFLFFPFFFPSSSSGPAGRLTLGNRSRPSRNAVVYSSCASSSSSSSPKGVSRGINSGVAYLPLLPLPVPLSPASLNGVVESPRKGVTVPPLRELGTAETDREAFRILPDEEAAGVSSSSGGGASEVDEYRDRDAPWTPVVRREREREVAILADRDDKRDEGGAYSDAGRGGYGSMIRTIWTAEIPKPGIRRYDPLYLSRTTYPGKTPRRRASSL